MMNLIKPKIFPDNIITGVTEKYNSEGNTVSLFETNNFNIDTVEENRTQLANQINVDRSNMFFQDQVHEDNIRVIKDLNDLNILNESDCVITDIKGIVLNVSIADCVAVLLYDPTINVIAAVHSGWRGTKAKITVKAIKCLENNFKVKPENLLAYISPAASGDKYEVGEDVAQYFTDFVKHKGKGKYLFDNKAAVKSQLINSGCREGNLEVSDLCTISNENLHSYRRDRDNAGRMSAFIGMGGGTLS